MRPKAHAGPKHLSTQAPKHPNCGLITLMRTRIACFALALAAAAGTIALDGQMRVNPLDDERGHVGLGLALRHLSNTGIAMQATAHPDDENNGLLVKLNRLEGYRTALATATRGNGGQNEIGPELFEALGVLRTQELEALHRFDGAEQYFTRAVDFGYSFSLDETFEKWGRDEIIEDYVHLIRLVRPDVMFALSPTGGGGGQHHQASSILAREAWKIAGDPTKYPEQIAAGLRAVAARRSSTFSSVSPARAAAPTTCPRCARTSTPTIRCSARPAARSASRRGACTSARARRGCSRCPARRPRPTSSSSPRSPVEMGKARRRSSTASTRGSPASRASRARAPCQALTRGLRADRRIFVQQAQRPSTTGTRKTRCRRSRRACAACGSSAMS